jgi:hypothetical protein
MFAIRLPDAAAPQKPSRLYVNSPYGIMLAHNGNLTNAEFLAKEIFEADLRNLETHSDSEVLLNVFAHEVAQEKNPDPTPDGHFCCHQPDSQKSQGGIRGGRDHCECRTVLPFEIHTGSAHCVLALVKCRGGRSNTRSLRSRLRFLRLGFNSNAI